jgi:GDP-L-fucose synthase
MKILVTGGSGLVGYALQKIIKSYNYEYLFISSKDVNLENYTEVDSIFSKYKPDYVIHLAAYVGGLYKNMDQKVDMFEKNIIINCNVLKCCHKYKIKKCISCLSTCIFPNHTKYPINEDMLHDGPPHNSNDAYAYAKRMLEVQSKAYQEQYDDNFICIIPTNIYGENDNYSLKDGHVIPALIHNCYLSKINNTNFIVKGSGKSLRQFIYSEDLAKLIMWTLEKYNKKKNIILSVDPKDEVSISFVAEEIAKNFDYIEKIKFDTSFSDGQFKKTACNKYLRTLNPEFNFTSIEEGIKYSVKWFCNNYKNCRK